MREEVIIAGFGGQGVVKGGLLLANAAMIEGKYCTHFPSYGAEMRGGTANCSVIISDEKIASPIINVPSTLIVMNEPSLLKFEPKVRKGGIIIFNSSIISKKISRKDVTSIPVPANKLAEEVGNPRAVNMIMLGAYVEKVKIVSQESLKQSLKTIFSKSSKQMERINKEAIERGRKVIHNL